MIFKCLNCPLGYVPLVAVRGYKFPSHVVLFNAFFNFPITRYLTDDA
jgi:hypothetical protein